MPEAVPAAANLLALHGDHLYRVVRYLGVSHADAEDVVQEVFLVALRNPSAYRGEGAVRSWLTGIARNLVRSERRRAYRHREHATEDPDAGGVATEDPERSVAFRESLRQLDAILTGLSDVQRLVFLLYDVEGMTMKEVTAVVGCPLQTGYTRLRAARAHVRRRAAAMELG